MKRILLPWSKVGTPGITAEVVEGDVQTDDPIVEVPHGAAVELAAAFAAFCGSWQQGDARACAMVAPLLAKYGVAPLPL
jgi:hypothetical protein